MAQEAIAFGAPRAEEMTRVVTGIAGAGITGAVEGIIVKLAPNMGALQPIFTWGTLLGIPTMAAAGALFTRGLLGDLFMGAACGGLGVIGYSLPEMLVPLAGRRAPNGGRLTAEQIAALSAGNGIKLLAGGVGGAALRAAQLAGVGLEI